MARRPSGSLEQEVLAVLATTRQPMTPADVHMALEHELAYTTVLTALMRLHEKGAVTRERSGRTHVYLWAADASTLTARRMRRLLDHGEDRESVLARFVAELGPEDGRLLAQLLDQEPPR